MTSKFQQAKTAAEIAAAIASTPTTDIVEKAHTDVTNTAKSSAQVERDRQGASVRQGTSDKGNHERGGSQR